MFDWWEDLTITSKALIFLVVALGLSTIAFFAGVYSDNKALIVLSGIIRSTTTLLVFLGIAVVGTAAGAVLGKGSESFQFFGGLAGSVFISQLMTTFFASFVPFRNLPELVPTFLIAALLLTALGFWTKFPKVTLLIVLVVFSGATAAFFFPGKFTRMQSNLKKEDDTSLVPKAVSLGLSDFDNGHIVLFGPKGEYRYWYFADKEGDFQVFSVVGDNTIHPQTGEPLTPLKKEDIPMLRSLLAKRGQLPHGASKASNYQPQRSESVQPTPETVRFLGQWTGQYSCSQGVSGLTLEVSEATRGVEAIFSFYPLPENPSISSGSYALTGNISHDGTFELVPRNWIRQANGYRMVGMKGVMEPNGSRLTGAITSRSCSTFALARRQGNVPPSPTQNIQMDTPALSPSTSEETQDIKESKEAEFASSQAQVAPPLTEAQSPSGQDTHLAPATNRALENGYTTTPSLRTLEQSSSVADVPPEYRWYYCEDPPGYYPQVRECRTGWKDVRSGFGPDRR